MPIRSTAVVSLLALASVSCGEAAPEPVSGGTTSWVGGTGGSSGPGSGASSNRVSCSWPEGQAAVSLTYDDALPTQLSTVGPALEAHDLRATFFLTDVRDNLGPWQALRQAGHEMASHTFNHPCPASMSWVGAGNANEDYDLSRMATELDESITMLESLGETAPYSFAYPCGETYVGVGQSYIPLVAERFMAARDVAPRLVDPIPDLMNVPAYFLIGTGEEEIAGVEKARAAGQWVVFGFHGVGGDWESVTEEAHEALLQYLDDNRSEVYVAPFREIASCFVQ